MGVDRGNPKDTTKKRNGESKDGSGNNSNNNTNNGNGNNNNRLPQVVRNIFQIMKGGKGSGVRRRNPKKMSIKRFVEKSIDAMAFFFTASFVAIAVVATIVLVGCIL